VAKQRAPFVTGVKELDMILRTFEDKEVKKAVTKASRETLKKYVRPRYKQKIQSLGFVDTKATMDVVEIKAVKRSRVRYGTELRIPHDKVIQEREARGGVIGYDKKRQADFYHPIAAEAGMEGQSPPRSLFKSLKENEQQSLSEFHKELRIALAKASARAKAKALVA
jgi:hypothetical protein